MVAMDVGLMERSSVAINEDIRIEEEKKTSTITDDSTPSSIRSDSVSSSISALSALEWKERGNKLYSLKKFPEALEAYDNAVETLSLQQQHGSSSSEISSLAISLHSNRAIVLFKMRKFLLAREECCIALRMDPENVKGLKVCYAHAGPIPSSNDLHANTVID